MSYRSLMRQADAELNKFHICRRHGAYWCGHTTPCPAISLKGWLRRKGYAYGQYQGTVKTDADRETIRRWADQFVARYYDRSEIGNEMFDAIPTSVLAMLGMEYPNAPLDGFGYWGKKHMPMAKLCTCGRTLNDQGQCPKA
jgi:hypothetical protein